MAASMLLSRKTFIKLKKGNNVNNTKKRKTDRVARFQTLTKEWGKSKFLSSQKCGAKEGRKLQLASFNKRNTENHMVKPKKSAPVPSRTYIAPTAKRRDNMTFKLRVLAFLSHHNSL